MTNLPARGYLRRLFVFPVACVVLTAMFWSGALSAHAQCLTWVQRSGTNKEYALSSLAMTWTQARAEAQSFGADLVIIQDQAEDTWLYQNMGTLADTVFPGTGGVWIGLSDHVSEGNFVWVDGSSLSYTNWAVNEPNGSGDYGHMYTPWSVPSGWDDTLELPGIQAGVYERTNPSALPHCLYPGSNEDFAIYTGVNAPPTASPSVNTATAGDVLTVRLDSPGATLYSNPFILVAQLFPLGGSAPSGPGPFASELYVNSGATLIVGPGSFSLNPILLPGGFTIGFQVPFFVFPQSMMLQGLLLPWAGQPVNNGFFATSDGHVINM